MEDRISLHPGRVELVPVPGQANVFDMVRQDDPQQEGTALNKANLLDDAVCELLGISADSVPKDALAKLALGVGKYGYKITVTTPKGIPIPGATVTGVTTITGGACVTGKDGTVLGVSGSKTVVLGVATLFEDLASVNGKQTTSEGVITAVSIVLPAATSNEKQYSASTMLHFSPDVLIADFCGIGGGSGGLSYDGGGGGYVANILNKAIHFQKTYRVEIGDGSRYSSGVANPGGSTIVYEEDIPFFTASGANARTGNGNGGVYRGTVASNGSGYKFNDPLLGVPGGGGGGGATEYAPQLGGGKPYGGTGGLVIASESQTKPGTIGKGSGGGGGSSGWFTGGGDGCKGSLFVRWHYK